MEAQLGKLQDPVESSAKAHGASFMAELLEALPGMPAEEKLDSTLGYGVCMACVELLPEDTTPILIPGTSDYEGELGEFENWTVGLLRNAIDALAAAGETTAEALLKTLILSARNGIMEAEEEEERRLEQQEERNLRLERKLSALMLLQPDVLEKVARYENGLERSLFRNLHELQRLQAARSGMSVTPPAAVDMTVHNDGSS